MVYELEDTSKVKGLFEGWQETLITSCLQKVEIVWNFLEEVGIPSLPTILYIQRTLKTQKTA